MAGVFVALIAVIPAKPAERARAGIHLFSKPLDGRKVETRRCAASFSRSPKLRRPASHRWLHGELHAAAREVEAVAARPPGM